MSGFRAVAFDLFGTLTPDMLRSDRLDMLRAMAKIVGAEPQAYLEVWDSREADLGRLTGRVTMRQEVERVVAALGLEPSSLEVDEALASRREWLAPFFAFPPTAVETMKLLRHHGLRLGLVSACTEEIPGLWQASPLAPYFDVTVFSCVVGVMKPEPEIYRLASEGLEIPAAETLYVGDGAFGELHGAEEAGMVAALIARPEAEEAHRPGWRDWTGERIAALPEVMRLVC